jgi:serine O-acetyltransferase
MGQNVSLAVNFQIIGKLQNNEKNDFQKLIMNNTLNEDLNHYTKNGNFFSKLKCVLISHSFHMVVLYRFGIFLSILPFLGVIFRVIIEYLIRIIFSSDISLKSTIGPGLMIVHGHDIVIGGDVVVGRNFKIFNGVTLGNKDTETNENQQPVIGDNVIVSTGAKLLGNIKIGDRVVVGANSVVLRSFDADCVVGGIPARILKKA